jgi:hypothetical protein
VPEEVIVAIIAICGCLGYWLLIRRQERQHQEELEQWRLQGQQEQQRKRQQGRTRGTVVRAGTGINGSGIQGNRGKICKVGFGLPFTVG